MQNTIKGSSFQGGTKLDNQCQHKLVGNRMVKYEGDTVCMYVCYLPSGGSVKEKTFSEIPLFKLGKRSRKEQCDV